MDMKQYQILRAFVVIIKGSNGIGVYVNGQLWRVGGTEVEAFTSLKNLFVGRLCMVDGWVVVNHSKLKVFPKNQNEIKHVDVPTYDQDTSHGVSNISVPPKDPEYTHVKWFVWLDNDGKLVTVFERGEVVELLKDVKRKEILAENPELTVDMVDAAMVDPNYKAIWSFTRDMATPKGGVKCIQYEGSKFPTIEHIKGKYQLSENYF